MKHYLGISFAIVNRWSCSGFVIFKVDLTREKRYPTFEQSSEQEFHCI